MNWRWMLLFWPVSPKHQEVQNHAVGLGKRWKGGAAASWATAGLASQRDPVLSGRPFSRTRLEVRTTSRG